MFRPDLYRADDPRLLEAQRRTWTVLQNGLRALSRRQTGPDARVAGVAAWSIVHGFASLWLNGLLRDEFADHPSTGFNSSWGRGRWPHANLGTYKRTGQRAGPQPWSGLG
jgi:hypothetical protein